MMPLVTWATAWLPESVVEHLEFEPELEDDEETDKEATDDSSPDVAMLSGDTLDLVKSCSTQRSPIIQGQARCAES
jgi:hypothetical protein